MRLMHYLRALRGIMARELLRFVHQRERFVSALVRPLVWLFIFAAGFRSTLGVAIIPPYETYILYEVYITPGLLGMILLFNGMQSSLSMVYDREMGSMKTLLVCPLPRWYLLIDKLLAGVLVAVLQAYTFLLIAWFYDIQAPLEGYLSVLPALVLSGLMLGALGLLLSSFVKLAYFWEIEPPTKWGYLTVLPALALSGLMLGALGMLLSSLIKQLENFAGVMNFVIFPMFFLSTALYPLWKVQESSELLYTLASYNPFSQAVELIRFALYGQFNLYACIYTSVALIVFLIIAIIGYNPSRGMMQRKGGPAA